MKSSGGFIVLRVHAFAEFGHSNGGGTAVPCFLACDCRGGRDPSFMFFSHNPAACSFVLRLCCCNSVVITHSLNNREPQRDDTHTHRKRERERERYRRTHWTNKPDSTHPPTPTHTHARLHKHTPQQERFFNDWRLSPLHQVLLRRG